LEYWRKAHQSGKRNNWPLYCILGLNFLSCWIRRGSSFSHPDGVSCLATVQNDTRITMV
jgi:hypothetical protein